MSPGEPYEDLLRSSLALSMCSLTTGGGMEDDTHSLQGTLAPSDVPEMALGDVTVLETWEVEAGAGTGAEGLDGVVGAEAAPVEGNSGPRGTQAEEAVDVRRPVALSWLADRNEHLGQVSV